MADIRNGIATQESKAGNVFVHEEYIKAALKAIIVDVPVGEFKGKNMSVWDLIHSKYLTEDKRQELLKNYKLTVSEIISILIRTIEEVERKKTKEFLPQTESYEESLINTLKSTTIDVSIGAYKGQKVTVWELLNSKYISDEKRKELLQKYQSGKLKEAELVKIIITTIEETEERSSKLKFKGLRRQVTATELLTSEIIDQITLNELTQGRKTVEEVTQMAQVKRYLEGTSCIAGVFVPSLKDATKKEKMSIYQAMRKRILRPGTALVLLEAQAATGFIIDPVKNTKLSVDEAVAANVIGQELHAKLLSAEKGVTGYTDPYTGQKISLFQAMNKDLIVKDHGIRLLEAQIATGGIIDPVHSHRVPVEVAYKRGYFDEEMNQILSDPSDDTKGFFDPNTHENLTYMQLLERCVRDPETGLYLLDVVKGSKDSIRSTQFPTTFKTIFTHVTIGHYKGQDVSVWELIHSYYFSEERRQEILLKYKSGAFTIDQLISELINIIKETEEHNFNGASVIETDSAQTSMQSKIMDITLGEFKGQKLSVWNLLNSKYVSEDKRNQLLEKYKSGKMSIEDIVHAISNIIKEREEELNSEQVLPVQSGAVNRQLLTEAEQLNVKDQINRALKYIIADVTTGEFQVQKKTVWEMLHSESTPSEERSKHLKKHKTTVEEIINSLFATIETTEHDTGGSPKDEEIKKALQSISIDVKVGQYTGQEVTVWDLLHSKYITEKQREELLKNYKLTIKEIINIIMRAIEETEEKRKKQWSERHNETSYTINEEIITTLKTISIDIAVGAFKGQAVSAWELLNSKYISEEKRKELLQKFQLGQLTESELITIITTIIEETEERSSKLKFKGLRRQVTATELLTSEIIDQLTLNELTQGRKTVEEVTQMDRVKRYLEGTSCIAGVFVPSLKDPTKKEKMSIYQAMWKRILRPGTALVLLEAQAATGFIIDPVKNTKLSVDEAVAADVIGQELHTKLLSAEKGVTGYTDPYTGQKISLFQAMNKDLIVKEHGIRLLEAQIATGGIIDPVHSHRVPVEVAYKRGYFDEEMNQILSDPSDDTKGFFDPNTHENLTYMQLLERCVRDPETGLYMLVVVGKGPKASLVDTQIPTIFKTTFARITVGHYKGQDVSLWELIHSYYFSEEKRQEILLKYKSGAITIDQLITELITIIKETEEHNFSGASVIEDDSAKTSMESKIMDITLGEFKGQKLSVWNLLNSKYVSEDKRNELLEQYKSGKMSIEDIVHAISNIIKEREEELISEQVLPVQNGAVNRQLLNEEEQLNSKDQINRALKYITADGITEGFQGQKKTLWEILHFENTPSEERNKNLKKHKTTVEEIIKCLVDTIEKTENEAGDAAHENEIKKALQSIIVDVKVGEYRGHAVTVWDLLHSKYITEKQREELLKNYKLTIKEIINIITRTIEETEEKRKKKGSSSINNFDYTINEKTTTSLKSLTIDVTIGAFKGQKVTVWELLNSTYISEEKRKELLQKLQSGELNESELITIITTIIEETEERSSKLKFKGLRRQVTATELLTSEIIDQMTLNELTQGRKTVEEVTQMAQVKRYLEGTSCIAGVFVPSLKDATKKEKMSIYQAMWRHVLRPGTALVLLEAQAATGFIIDPLKNTKLSVDEAVAADVIGQELHAKLLSAEKGVTGYTDPYTGQKISLFQAMNKDLIVKDHGIRLLEAQIATGGIIDPVHSHRVPVEVAYKRGYFDEEMNQILSDPSDDTKGFFDPNTHENLTYMQLLERCVRDPETGLYMLDVVGKGSKDLIGDTQILTTFKNMFTRIAVGRYKGQDVSVWELIHSYYFSVEKRQEILLKYKSGAITIDQLMTELITIIKETEEHNFSGASVIEDDSAKTSMESKIMDITLGEFKGQKLSVWNLLNSKYVSEDKRNELLEQYKSGKMSIEDIVHAISNIIKEREEELNSEQVLPVQNGAVNRQLLNEEEQLNVKDQINRAIKYITADVTTGEFQVQKKTVWEILHSVSIPSEERNKYLKKHKTTVEEIIKSLVDTIEKAENEAGDAAHEDDIKKALQSITVEISVGQYRGQTVTVWELLHSKYITEKQRKELLKNYKLTLKEIINVIMRAIEETEEKRKKKGSFNINNTDYTINEAITATLMSLTIDVAIGAFKGQKVTVWELLNSTYISEEKRKELLQKLQSGEFNESELITIITTIIEETEERSSKLKFKGLRRQVTATELLTSEIIDQMTLNELTQGRKTVEEVTQMAQVKRYLEGTSCIAGVFVPSLKDPTKKEKMSIYQAMWKRILRPGTALVLLEAQAATGFIIDPLKNTKLSVDEAVAADVIGQELHAKLLSAEKGVTGYTDPYTGQKISLFQAMNKDLIVKDHGIRLLEAQIATGGIIDPVHSHRVPVEVAYKRGYFDEEMNQILSDPSDDTKGFFDPNTHENLTYMQLVERCVRDPETGLYMLEVFESFDRNIQTIFQAKLVHLDVGHFQGQDISLWQLLYSQYFTEEKRQEIFRKYKSGTLNIDNLITEAIIIVKEKEAQMGLSAVNLATEANLLNIGVDKREKLQQSIQSQTIDVKLGEFKGQKLSVLDLLHSKYFSPERRKEMLEKYNSGAMSIENICCEISTIIKEMEDRLSEAGTIIQAESTEQINRALQFISINVTAGEFERQRKTLWELLHSKYTEIEKRKILLEKHRLTVEEIRNVLTSAVEGSEYTSSTDEQIQRSLQSEMLDLTVGQYRGKKISVWDLLNSKDISEEARKEFLEKYKSGTLTLKELITAITVTLEISDPSDEQLRKALEDVMVDAPEGKCRDQKVSVWDLLQSEYIIEDQRKELLNKCRFTVREITAIVTSIINERGGVKLDLNDVLITSQTGDSNSLQREELTQKTMKSTFVKIPVGELKGQELSLWDILESNYVSLIKKSELLEEYHSGTLSLDEITTTLITIIEKTEERRSMLMFKGLRRQVSAAELLSSEIIDQKTLNELIQGIKTLEEVTETQSVKRYLEGTSCIAGVLVPLKTDISKKEKMSIHQAMRKNILRPGTALVLLEAQAATGFVIDPLQNRKLSVDDAVSSGVVGKELHIKLLSAEKAVTGYTDPYTGNKISLFQAMNKDLIVKDHGIRLLESQIATGGIIDPVHSHRVPVEVAYKRGYFDEEMNQILSDPSDDTKGFFDPNTHENLTYMQLLERCVRDPETGLYMLDIVQKGSSWFQIDKSLQTSMQSRLVHVSVGKFNRETVSVWDLFFSRYITEEKRQDLLKKYQSGTLSFEQLTVILTTIISENEGKSNRENVNFASKKQENESVHQSISFISENKNKDSQENDNIATKVQKAENQNQLMYVNGNIAVIEGKSQGHSEKASNAKEAREDQIKKTLKYFYVNFTDGSFHGQTPNLWALLSSKHIPKDSKHILYKKYIWTIEEVISMITNMIKEMKSINNEVSLNGEQMMILQAALVEITFGEFSGQKLSVWELLGSKYISEEKKKELMAKYASGELTLDELIKIITTIIVETEERSSKLKFRGLRRQVTASELLSSEIIDQKTLNELTQGNKTVEEVTQMDSVKRYLEGTNCIAGVLVPSKQETSLLEKMSIYEAMRKRILRPGTALVLLEAQAATGFMINPVTNEKLSVDEAVSAGLVGKELHAKLLSAEKAVTGYTDPYTEQKISLFQAMHKDLIVKDHGIRLLEAQIATGGIIDPVHSHRVPVEVAYKRGYFDEEMNQILSDPSDDTKGFFDPNTHENLTYMQLVERGIQDIDTGLCLLSVNRK